MATHSSVLAWRIPGTGEPGGLPSMGSHRVGQDLAAAARNSLLANWLLGMTISDIKSHREHSNMLIKRYYYMFSKLALENKFKVKLLHFDSVVLNKFYLFFLFIYFFLVVIFFKFYFILKIYIIVLVLPNIKMNPPQVYMCSPS